MKLRLKPKSVRILRALLAGQTLVLDGFEYVIQDGRFGSRAKLFTPRSIDVGLGGEDVLMETDITLTEFIAMCERVDEEQIITMLANVTLTEMGTQKTRRLTDDDLPYGTYVKREG